MFRPPTVRTAFSVTRRKPIHVSRQPLRYDSTVRVQRVRFQRHFFTRKRLAAVVIYAGAFFAYQHFVLGPVDSEVEREEQERQQRVANGTATQADYEDEDAEELEPIFIPLGLAKARPRTFYKGSDPEWQEFRKIAPDQKRHEKMRDQLVSIVRTAIANDKRFTRRMGQINTTLGAHWLDITFPDGPPLEYERAGIEIGEDHITWTTRPVTQMNYHRLNRAIYPTAVFYSMYASGRYLLEQHTRQVREFLGLQTEREQKLKQLEEKQKELKERIKEEKKNDEHRKCHADMVAKQSANSSHRDSDTATPTEVNPQATGTPQSPPTPTPSSNPKEKNVSLPTFDPPPPNSIALSIFAHTLARKWNPVSLEPPRGTIVVSGLIEVKGTRARATIDVAAAYDPKIDKYVVLKAAVRRIQDMSQVPKGGN